MVTWYILTVYKKKITINSVIILKPKLSLLITTIVINLDLYTNAPSDFYVHLTRLQWFLKFCLHWNLVFMNINKSAIMYSLFKLNFYVKNNKEMNNIFN